MALRNKKKSTNKHNLFISTWFQLSSKISQQHNTAAKSLYSNQKKKSLPVLCHEAHIHFATKKKHKYQLDRKNKQHWPSKWTKNKFFFFDIRNGKKQIET